MKKLTFIIAALFILGMSSIAMADGLGLGIATSGSPHNFTDGVTSEDGGAVDESWNNTGEICRVCHIPHDHHRTTFLNSDVGLLWNRDVSTATYNIYDSAWGLKVDGATSQPDGVAKLCLGCHDGTIALDAFNGNTPTAGPLQDTYDEHFRVVSQAGVNGADMDMRGTHPVSIVYGTDDMLHDDTDDMGSYGDIASVLDNGKVQCSSCHDVHDQESVPDTHLLRVAQKDMGDGEQASGLCLTCHVK